MMTPRVPPPSVYIRRNLELRAAEYYASIRKPESEWMTIDDLSPQLAEFEHRVEAADYDAACQVIDGIDSSYLSLWGYNTRLVQMRTTLTEKIQSLDINANNLEGLADALRAIGEFQLAIGYYEQGLALVRDIKDRTREGRMQGNLGSAYWMLGQYDKGLVICENALAIAREVGNQLEVCKQLGRLGRFSYQQGHFEQAITFHEKAIKIARQIKNRQWEGYVSGTLGNIQLALGQFEAARTLYEASLKIAQEMGERRGEGVRHRSLGHLYQKSGNLEKALLHYHVALALSRDTADRVEEGRIFEHLGDVYLDLEDYIQALNYYEKALTISQEVGYRRGQAYCLLKFAKAKLITGDLVDAQHLGLAALSLKVPEVDYHAVLILGIALLCQNTVRASAYIADAILYSQELLAGCRDCYIPQYVLATALVVQAVCDPCWLVPPHHTGLLALALAEYRRALTITAAPGVVRDAIRDLELIRAAGFEGLEPVFGLLEGALHGQR